MKDRNDSELENVFKWLHSKSYPIFEKMEIDVSGDNGVNYFFDGDIDITIISSNKLNPESEVFISKFNALSKDSSITVNDNNTICLHITGRSTVSTNASSNIYDLLD